MKAIALISGGLDSILAAKVIKSQGIEVIPLKFIIPFSGTGKERINSLVRDSLGKEAKTMDISADFLKLLEKPRHGFGSGMNPCIDCKILMLTRAKELMRKWQADFVVTGEVLGQRPMSQNKQALGIIEKKAGLEGLLLRPLSARAIAETVPEKENWVRRGELFSFIGRSRQPQIELARALKIKDYAQPAGGCLLTDPEFSKRLKELITRGELNLNNIELLKIGRHFRIAAGTKLVVGRNEKENRKLENLARQDDYLFYPGAELAGPTSLGRGSFNAELLKLSCRITCRYCDLKGEAGAAITYRRIPEKEDNSLRVSPPEKEELANLRV
ncbi:MAG: tRNA 4-thiouridine(8) synthase ThiI [Candidatus Omnitrophota bacterium]|jgi:tRNA U34 2-thiouridine synthase MnmA/TrmU